MSARRSTDAGLVICSGAMNSGVPITMLCWRSSTSMNREMPKSSTFT